MESKKDKVFVLSIIEQVLVIILLAFHMHFVCVLYIYFFHGKKKCISAVYYYVTLMLILAIFDCIIKNLQKQNCCQIGYYKLPLQIANYIVDHAMVHIARKIILWIMSWFILKGEMLINVHF